MKKSVFGLQKHLLEIFISSIFMIEKVSFLIEMFIVCLRNVRVQTVTASSLMAYF